MFHILLCRPTAIILFKKGAGDFVVYRPKRSLTTPVEQQPDKRKRKRVTHQSESLSFYSFTFIPQGYDYQRPIISKQNNTGDRYRNRKAIGPRSQ